MIRYLRKFSSKDRQGEIGLGAGAVRTAAQPRRAMICLFLAVLELVKLQAVGLVQKDAFGEIGLKRLDGFEAAFAAEQVMSAIDEGYK